MQSMSTERPSSLDAECRRNSGIYHYQSREVDRWHATVERDCREWQT